MYKLGFSFVVDLAAQEKHYKQKLEQMSAQHEQELFKLKQENFVLSAKVRLKLIYVQLSPKFVCDVYCIVCRLRKTRSRRA